MQLAVLESLFERTLYVYGAIHWIYFVSVFTRHTLVWKGILVAVFLSVRLQISRRR